MMDVDFSYVLDFFLRLVEVLIDLYGIMNVVIGFWYVFEG